MNADDNPAERTRINIGLEKKIRQEDRKFSPVTRRIEELTYLISETGRFHEEDMNNIILNFAHKDFFLYVNMKMLTVYAIYKKNNYQNFRDEDIEPILMEVLEEEFIPPPRLNGYKKDLIRYSYLIENKKESV